MITTVKQLAKVVPEVCSTRLIPGENKYILIVTGKEGEDTYDLKRDLVIHLIREQAAYHMNILTIDKERLKNTPNARKKNKIR
jgi:hypothetical protein